MSPSSKKALTAVLFAALTAPLIYTLFDDSDGDVPLYHTYATKLFAGEMPYRDFTFEYPPVALLPLLLPKLIANLWHATDSYPVFRAAFSLQVLALDVAAKIALLRAGPRLSPRRPLLPFLVFSALAAFHCYFYLKRFDAYAAWLVLFALLAADRARFAICAALLVLGAGIKLYPALLGPALLVYAWRQRATLRFLAGGAIALVPLAVLAIFAPWWSFASFHVGRGLQAESIYASVLWLLHFFGLPATWASAPGCIEIAGPGAGTLLPVARVLFAVMTMASVATSALYIARRGRTLPFPDLVRALVFPILCFITFNIVLSPQYLAWVIAPAAFLIVAKPRGSAVALILAVMLTTFIFPAPGYFSPEGIGPVTTAILVARNVVLLVGIALLGRELAISLRPKAVPT